MFLMSNPQRRISGRAQLAIFAFWLLLGFLFLQIPLLAAPPEGLPAGFPEVQMPGKLRGEAAISALGNHLPEIAAFYRTTAEELRNRLLREHSLWVDEYGRLFYVCNWPAPLLPPVEEPPTPTPLAVSPAGYPYEQTFLLHSRPASTKVVYLDFDGHDASATSWGSDAIGRPFDLDSDPTTFSNTERDRIQYIWLRVAEDFALYDIDVTTQDPGVEALRKSSASDLAYGIRVVIGGSSSDWFGSAGGVAYIGSFNWNSDTPTWVWPGSLSSTEKNIAEATSHEVGHTVGLNHDGQDVGTNHTEYFGGHGNWAPIMGVGYSRPITQWSKGEYTNANNLQDDLTVMLSYGPAYRPDDHGNSIAAATLVNGVGFSVAGNIERTTDLDFFRFTTGSGRVGLTATPAPRGPNLRTQLSLYNNFGVMMASTNVADTSAGVLPVTLTAVLPIGTYFISVEGIGSLNPTNTGYSEYASIGQYTLSGVLPSDSGWIATLPGGDYSWTNGLNWASNAIPIGSDATARMVNNIQGDQTIALDMPITVGRLFLGDPDGMQAFTLQDGSAGSLTFNSSSNQALLIKTTGANDLIAATITLQTNLVVTNSSAGSLNLAGNINGNGGLIKQGSGVLILSGNNSYSGRTIASSGTLLLAPAASIASSSIEVQSNAVLDFSSMVDGFNLAADQSLNGAGVVLGDVVAPSGATIVPGTNGLAGTLSFSNNLSLGSGSKLTFDLAANPTPGSGTNDLISIAGSLSLEGTVLVDLSFVDLLSPAVYTLITYGGNLTGAASNLVAANATRYGFVFDDTTPGEIRLQVSGSPGNLVWQGDGILNRWDVAGAANWADGTGAAQFFQLDEVTFDDSGTNSPAISFFDSVRPSSITVNASKNYTFVGAGKLSGAAELVKQGSGTLLVGTANDYNGPTTVIGGILRAGNSAALGSPTGPTTVQAGAALDLNAFSLGAEPITVQGTGLGSGALFNGSPSTQINALRFLTLSGNTTLGGSGRWDIRANPTGFLVGNNFNLTKTNANEIWLAELGPTGLGDVYIDQGSLALQGSTTLGDGLKSLTMASNTSLALWSTDNNVLSKNLVMNSSALHSYSGDNIFSGTLALNGSNTITASNIFTLQAQINGAGSLRKVGSGILALTASNSFSGNTTIAAGTLQVRNSWALGSTNAGTIISTGARLDVNGINLGAEPVTVQGTGLGNAGAIINTGASQMNALRFVTLAGNTTFGGIGRWDIRANPTGSLTGNNFNLTKTGPNEVWLVDLGASGLISLIVNEGVLGFQGSTTMGNAASPLTVNSAGTIALWANGTNILSKVVTMNTARFFNGNGSNVFSGAITLNASNRFDAASSTTLVLSGPIGGSGSLHAISSGTLILAANSSYSGVTRIVGGTLQFGDGGGTGAPGGGNITNNAILAFHRTNSFTLANFITGSGVLRHGIINAANPYIGSVLTLSGNNSYSGQSIINGNGNFIAVVTDLALGTGTLVFNGNNNGDSVTGLRSANSNPRILNNNLQFGGGNSVQFGAAGTGDLVFNGAQVITDSSDKTLIISNALTTLNNSIGGNSRIIKSGPGTLVLGGNNTNGACFIHQGIVRINGESRLGRNPSAFTLNQLTLNGGTLQTTASFAIDDSNRGVTVGASGGNFNVNAGTTLTVANVITGLGNLLNSGTGTLRLTAGNTCTGAITNLAGTLVIDGAWTGSLLDITAGTLSGNGVISAPVSIGPAASLSPGSASISALTISNNLLLAGTTVMDLNKTLATNDLIRGLTEVTYGGSLSLANLSGVLAGGDSFKLFDAATYTGSFTNIIPSSPGQWMIWDLTSLPVDGTLKIKTYLPQFSQPVISGSTLLFSGSGGPPNGTFYVLSSTNLSSPASEWTLLSTNVFDAGGNFNFVTPLNSGTPKQFYRIQLP